MKYFFTLLPAVTLVAAGPGINPNPDPNFDPSTSRGTAGKFVPAIKAAVTATGGPATVDPRTLQAMQLAISNWQTDTGLVTGFLDVGKNTKDSDTFKGIADGAFKAEVDELTQKSVLDAVIGNDPRVSIANLTLTNGVFQSVVDNLQIMSLQGRTRANLIDIINNVRCTQILPSIDTYMIVAAEYIGGIAQQRRAVRPNACAAILKNASASAFALLPGTPKGSPAGTGNGVITGIPNACTKGAGNLTQIIANSASPASSAAPSAAPANIQRASVNSGAGAAANSPLNVHLTPLLGLPGFPSLAAEGENGADYRKKKVRGVGFPL